MSAAHASVVRGGVRQSIAAAEVVPGDIRFGRHAFSNAWLWGAVALSLVLQAAVIYVPFLQQAFSTVALGASDWLVYAAVASSVLLLRELGKLITYRRSAPTM